MASSHLPRIEQRPAGRGRRIAGWGALVLAWAFVAMYAGRCFLDFDVMQPWWSEASFIRKQAERGYRVYGRIEGPPRWPAIATRRVDGAAAGGVSFHAPSGQHHVYQNFPDVEFKAVTFLPSGRNASSFVMVLGRKIERDD
jgi:hypothetical protein